jgi:hypothetical protein
MWEKCLEKSGCGEGMTAFIRRADQCVERAELCCAALQDRAGASRIHQGRFWLSVGKTLCQ